MIPISTQNILKIASRTKMNPYQIARLAKKYGWKQRSNTDPWVLIFDQGGGQINVWFTKMTVGTFLRVKGWTDYKRGVYHRGVGKKELVSLLQITPKNGSRESTYKPSNKPFKLPKITIESMRGII